jgi:hypothetical protein
MERGPRARAAFAEAADWLVDATSAVGDRWTEPALGVWDLRALVGHTSRALVTVIDCVAGAPPRCLELAGAADYVGGVPDFPPERHERIAESGVEAGAALGHDPVATVRELAARAVAAIRNQPDDRLVATGLGSMRLADYLDARAFELVVHVGDIWHALGADSVEPPPAAAAVALEVLSATAIRRHVVADVVAVLTGRAPSRKVALV